MDIDITSCVRTSGTSQLPRRSHEMHLSEFDRHAHSERLTGRLATRHPTGSLSLPCHKPRKPCLNRSQCVTMRLVAVGNQLFDLLYLFADLMNYRLFAPYRWCFLFMCNYCWQCCDVQMTCRFYLEWSSHQVTVSIVMIILCGRKAD